MLDTLQLIYKANNQGIYLWTEGHKLKSKFPKSFNDKALIEQLSANKVAIVEILSHNKIDSADIKLPRIYQDPTIEEYELSFAQDRLWFIEQYEQGTNAYHIPMLVELKSTTDQKKLTDAIKEVVRRHESLRTVFRQKNEQDYQVPLKKELEINEYNSSNTDIETQLQKDISTPFDLKNEFPLRVCLYHQKESTNLLINMHHIASDGWSSGILMKEVNALYNGETLPELAVQYKDFSLWQKEYLQGDMIEEQLSYWKEKLEGYEPLNLSLDKTRPNQIDYTGDDVLFTIDEKLSKELRNLSEEQGCTLYSTLLSGFYILLNKYSSQDDIIVGAPIANRHYTGIQDLIGFFVNSSALREKIDLNSDALTLLNQVKQTSLESQQYQDLPFEKIVELLDAGQDPSKHPVFQVTFSLQSLGSEEENELFTPLSSADKHAIAKYDLSCFIDDAQTEIRGSLNFATALYEKETIERMADHFKLVLEQMISTPTKKIKEYSLLTDTEYKKIVIDWNQTEGDYVSDKTIYQLFEEQATKTPNHIAAVFNNEELTYTQLNERANQLARHLQAETTIEQGTLIALFLDRSLDMVIGILGILKAGGTYVPIDPEYPADRIQYILDDTQTQLAVTQSNLEGKLSEVTSIKRISLDTASYTSLSPTAPVTNNTSADLAYVIYTSGTTGQPKGVCVAHQSLNNLVDNQVRQFEIKEKSNVLLFASLIFDASISEIFTTITSGACLHIVPNETRKSSNDFIDYLREHKINIATIPPVFLNTLEYTELKDLTTIVVAGESCSENLMKKWSEGRTLINAYGPTESTVCATMHTYKPGDSNLNIGKPIANGTCYVLDKNNFPVPVGAIGELHVGGQGLAKGYLNNPELTNEKFIDNPFASPADLEKGYSKLYKTGDEVRWLPDGSLEYIGRNDFQVKVRGIRVELGEIEQVLENHPSIAQTCVVASEKSENKKQNLIAYYKPEIKPEKEISWWPSIAEYYVYDKFLYGLMTTHETRNECYRAAIKGAVKGKIVLDIGTGPDTILSRICIEEGAAKVYAIEYLEATYLKAQETIKKHNLEDKITLIHGDCREVELPEQVDVCVSELVGAIGGSEGVAVLLNDAMKRHLKPEGTFIPERSLTKLALIELPESLINEPVLDEKPQTYTKQIFDQVGYPFDLRLCLKGVSEENLISSIDTFEDLDWRNSNYNEPDHTHSIQLKITKDATIYGALVWMDLIVMEGQNIDVLEDQHSWIPVFIPLFPEGIKVEKGDYIEGTIERFLCENKLNCDYIVKGKLVGKNQKVPFNYNSTHYSNLYKQNSFYKNFFDLYENYEDVSLERLHEYMASKLPDYLIPDTFIPLDEFPLTFNGKLDRKALPDPEFINEASFVAPETELEKTLSVIWQELLNIDQVGVTDDFFRIGGDSILSIQLSSRLRKEGIICSMKVLFENRTIERLAHYIEVNTTTVEVVSEQGKLEGSFELLPIQQWFFDQKENQQFAKSNHWNQSILVKVPSLDVDKLPGVIEQLTTQHDMLNVLFSDKQQTYGANKATPELHRLNVAGLSADEINSALTDWQSNFDIENGPLWNISYLEGYEDNSARLYFAVHHLIVDAVSWRILIDDFKALYAGEKLEEKTSSYRQWIEEVQSYEEKNSEEKEYWSSILNRLPTDEAEESEAYSTSFRLSQEYTSSLLNQTNTAYQTEVNDLLLTALGHALRDLNDSSIHGITLEGHGRETISDAIDHSKTVGWFTTMYPVQLNVQEELSGSIKSIKESLRAVPNKGIGFGAIYPNELSNLPRISFNYLGQFDTQDDFWQIAAESSGNSVHSDNTGNNIIALNGMVAEGQLTFTVSTRLGEDESIQFMEDFQYHLEEVISHCKDIVEQGQVQYTPSDFESVSISQSLLDKIQQN